MISLNKLTVSRIKKEFCSPSIKSVRFIFHAFYSFINLFFNVNYKREKALLVWDIRVNSVTFDFIFVIFYVLNSIRCKSIKSFDLIIFCPKDVTIKPFSWSDYNKYVSEEDIINRIKDMILPLADAFDCVDKVLILEDETTLIEYIRDFRFVFPRNYHPRYFYVEPLDYLNVYKILKNDLNIKIPSLSPPKSISKDLQTLESKINGKNYMTITLRDYGYAPTRNTNDSDIKNAFLMAGILQCILVIVPDNISKLDDYNINSNILISYSARNNLKDRISLYSKSIVNIFKPSGPAYVSIFLKGTKTLYLDNCEGGPDCNEKYYKKNYDLIPGDQPYLQFGCYIFWKKLYPNYSYNDLLDKFYIL